MGILGENPGYYNALRNMKPRHYWKLVFKLHSAGAHGPE